MQFCKSLFALMSLKLGPELKMLIDYFESLVVVLRQFDLFPKLFWKMGPFNCLHIKITHTFLFKYGGIPCVSQWT
jgi:hypothetical protein